MNAEARLKIELISLRLYKAIKENNYKFWNKSKATTEQKELNLINQAEKLSSLYNLVIRKGFLRLDNVTFNDPPESRKDSLRYLGNIYLMKIYYLSLDIISYIGHNYEISSDDYIPSQLEFVENKLSFYESKKILFNTEYNRKLEAECHLYLCEGLVNILCYLLNRHTKKNYQERKVDKDNNSSLHKEKDNSNLSIMNDKFDSYKEIAETLGLTEKQASYLAGICCDFPRKEIMELTETNRNSVGGLKREVGKKLGFDGHMSDLNDYMKNLVNVMSDPIALEAANAVYNGTLMDKMEIVTEYLENKRIADMVRSNPEIKAIIDREILNQTLEKDIDVDR